MNPMGYYCSNTVLSRLPDLLQENGITSLLASNIGEKKYFKTSVEKTAFSVDGDFLESQFNLPAEQESRLHALLVVSGCKYYGLVELQNWPTKWMRLHELLKPVVVAEILIAELRLFSANAGLIALSGELYRIGVGCDCSGTLFSFICPELTGDREPKDLAMWDDMVFHIKKNGHQVGLAMKEDKKVNDC